MGRRPNAWRLNISSGNRDEICSGSLRVLQRPALRFPSDFSANIFSTAGRNLVVFAGGR